MKKKIALFTTLTVSMAAVVAVSTISVMDGHIFATAGSYTMVIGDEDPTVVPSNYQYFHNVNYTNTLRTSYGNQIRFATAGLSSSGGHIRYHQANSYVYNMDPIHGMTSVQIYINPNYNLPKSFLTISYSGEPSFNDYYSKTIRVDTDVDSETKMYSYNFEGRKSNYLRISVDNDKNNNFNSSVSIICVKINYTCEEDPYKGLNLSVGEGEHGTVQTPTTKYIPGEEATAIAVPEKDYEFEGWYEGGVKLTEPAAQKALYKFTMPNSDRTLEAKFTKKSNADILAWNQAHYADPELQPGGTKVKFGIYPQTLVTDEDLIDDLSRILVTDEKGYIYYENEYYVRVKYADPRSDDNPFRTDSEIVTRHKTYYFKCEPVTWSILRNEGTEYTLFCDSELDCMPFAEGTASVSTYQGYDYKTGTKATVNCSDYKYSSVRTFLNTVMVKRLFDINENNNVIEDTVDNSGTSRVCTFSNGSTISETNTNWLTDDTVDKLFLPCATDLEQMDPGQGDKEVRRRYATDYGMVCNSNPQSSRGGAVDYLTRSPYSQKATIYATFGGSLSDSYTWGPYSVVPACKVSITA